MNDEEAKLARKLQATLDTIEDRKRDIDEHARMAKRSTRFALVGVTACALSVWGFAAVDGWRPILACLVALVASFILFGAATQGASESKRKGRAAQEAHRKAEREYRDLSAF